MPVERAGYTVTMFIVDVSSTMGKMRQVERPDTTAPGGMRLVNMSNLEWALQYVKLKMQEMIFNGRKTDQCGVIVFGTEETDNIINTERGSGYSGVTEYIPITHPNAGTLAKLSALRPSKTHADPIDAIIVGIQTQSEYLGKKASWTRRIILVTDGDHPIEIEDWERTAAKMNELNIHLTIVGIDFDDEELPFKEEEKSVFKRENEAFYAEFISALDHGAMGTYAFALQEAMRPDFKQVKSMLMANVLRLGDVETRPDEALEIQVKTSKCTALSRPKEWKKFARAGATWTPDTEEDSKEDVKAGERWAQLHMRTEYYVENDHEEEDRIKDDDDAKDADHQKVEKEQLVKGFKYGSTYVPCPDGQFPKLDTTKGIDICGFFREKNFRREYPLGEVQYVCADPNAAGDQLALSSLIQAMYEKNVYAITRWVGRDGAEPRMGVLKPYFSDSIEYLLWVQMPFADDVRKYTFPSLTTLVNKNGQPVTKHPYLPTEEQQSAMDSFVDAMDLMYAGEKDEEGVREAWFDTRISYNPAIHRTKHALFHSALVDDLITDPLPPPHPELTKYFDPPRRVLKRAREPINECINAFKPRQVPKKVVKIRKDGHVRAQDDDGEMLLLDTFGSGTQSQSQTARSQYRPHQSQAHAARQARSEARQEAFSQKKKQEAANSSGSETESDDEDLLLDAKGKGKAIVNTTVDDDYVMIGSQDADPGRAPGRIIGSTRPLDDFKRNIAHGDLVTKAVEDLGVVICEIVQKPFAGRRHAELIDCLEVLRQTALMEDEVDAWNDFLHRLKSICFAQPGNPKFWEEVKKLGRKISLISNREAQEQSGQSTVSEEEAVEFLKS